MKPKPYLLTLFIALFSQQVTFAQLLPNVNKQFQNVEIYKIHTDKQGKAIPILIRSEQAISRFEVTTDEAGDRTYLKFYSSLYNGESVKLVTSTKKELQGNTTQYTVYCSDIVRDENSTWYFYWKDGVLIDVIETAPEQNAMLKYK